MEMLAPTRGRQPLRRSVAVVLAAAVLAACATVPYTGRRQLALVSLDSERSEGEQLYRIMHRRAQVARDARATAMVREVGHRIAAAAGQPGWDWEFTLFDDRKQVNAWALPGGKVGVYSGLLPVAQDEAGLAVILGHEVAHAIAHHSAERQSQSTLLGVLGTGLAIAAGTQLGQSSTDLLMQAYGLGAQVGVLLPFSRSQESEADEIGLILMAKAGYDPRAALGLWQRMAEAERGQGAPPEFLSTHPSYGTRVERIERAIPRALVYYEDGSRVRNARLPALAELESAPPGETELLEAVQRLDRIARGERGSRALASAIGDAFRVQPRSVVDLGNRAGLTAGETALVLAIQKRTGASVSALVGDAQRGRSWYDTARAAGAAPAACADDLTRIAQSATGGVRLR